MTDHIRFPKIRSFLAYLRERAEVTVIIAEEQIMDFEGSHWEFDVVLAKCKDTHSQAILTTMERKGIPIINPPRKIFMTCHRFIMRSVLAAKGIPQPDFSISFHGRTPFPTAIVKDHFDDSANKSPPYILVGRGFPAETRSDYFYSEEFLDPEREFKVYGIGDSYFTFAQDTPLIYKPDYKENKHRLRSLVSAPEAEDLGRRAADAMGLSISSTDVISSGGRLYVADVNSSPSLKDELIIEAVSDHLMEVAL